MNRNLLPLTLFGIGFLMLYSGYKNLHPIDGVLKPVLRGQKPSNDPLTTKDGVVPLEGKVGNPYSNIPGAPGTPPANTAPVPPPPGKASGGSSGSGTTYTPGETWTGA